MKNRNQTASPFPTLDPYETGLTKLEYAAIHLASGMLASDVERKLTRRDIKDWSVRCANSIFDELEKDQ